MVEMNMKRLLAKIKGSPIPPTEPKSSHEVADVGDFYNEYTDKFLQVYGKVIQAFRTRDVAKLLDYQIQAMELRSGMTVLDAGCGVCGPAIHFAQHAGVQVKAVTISQVQVDMGREDIAKNELQNQVQVQLGDYHRLPEYFAPDTFDVVYFLESFGHSPNHALAIDSAWKVLKPGGLLYIKDLFVREPMLPEQQPKIQREVDKINQAYRYNLASLYEVLRHIRKQGWILSKLKTVDLPLHDFENLTISNEFQELTGIAKIENWDDYVFPVDFFELHLVKPAYDLSNGLDKYFLQNLMYMQVHGKKQEEL